MKNFKPAAAIRSGLRSVLTPVIFVVVLIALVYSLFRFVEKQMSSTPRQVDVEESTQLGVKTGSLNAPGSRTPAPRAHLQPSAALNNVQATAATKSVKADEKLTPEVKFNQVNATFTVAEVSGVDFYNEEETDKSWHLVSQFSPINSFVTEEMNLKTGTNSYEFVDDLIRYDIALDIEKITDKEVSVKINLRRSLRVGQGAQSYSASLTANVPMDQSIIIVDTLPRNGAFDRPNSILSTLYKSQLFLSRASELVQIIKFDNPSNSPQESLTP